MSNKDLHTANKNKKDEFYTRFEDIEAEMKYYKDHFRDKVIFCNCNDPFESNFFKYFVLNFNNFSLKKLITTSYAYSSMTDRDVAYKSVITEVKDLEDVFSLPGNELTELKEDGDYRSQECLELLDEADIVVTNPPWSMFIGYVEQLMSRKKDFIILGNITAVQYSTIFPFIKNNQIRLGVSAHSGDRVFYVPDDYPFRANTYGVDENGRRFIKVKGARWYTTLGHGIDPKPLNLDKRYNPYEYQRIDNYDAINVDKTKDIPFDYDGVMGVPITFLDKYNPNQFEILGVAKPSISPELRTKVYDKQIFHKIANGIDLRSYTTGLNTSAAIELKEKPNHSFYEVDGKFYKLLYSRILIRRK